MLAFILAACARSDSQRRVEAVSGGPQPPAIPAVGARVRVVVPQLGPGWRVGMFNRTRQEPPCYLVLLLSQGPIREIDATVPIRAVTRLQVSVPAARSDSAPVDDAAAALDGEAWMDASPDSAQRVGRRCGDSVRAR
jgi:hypothetical protein